MYHFDVLEDVVSTLGRLNQRDPSLATVLPRQPGTKEARYMHLFSGQPQVAVVSGGEGDEPAQPFARPAHSATDRLTHLEQEVSRLREEVSTLQQQMDTFRKQFE
jgi:hypothetical protein